MSNFAERLSGAAERITLALDALLALPPAPEARLMEAMRHAALAPGKRLRPFLTLECGYLFDADEGQLLRAALAIECVQTYSLIHDDLPCMDDDDMRRGLPTVHKAFDEATAVLAGNALLTLAFELLSDPATHQDPQMRGLLITGLAKAAGAQGMLAGQMLDTIAEKVIGDDLIQITRMNRLKTGALIQFSADAGALIGCASDEERQCLSRYAHDLGLAFQMADDLLDVEGSTKDLGKTAGKDAAAGKVNFVTVLGVEQTRERVRLLAAQAKRHLHIFGPRGKVLSDLVDFVLDRKY
ncbi:MAG: polyprenyl synthetase family protein [Caulobacterales bacterium]